MSDDFGFSIHRRGTHRLAGRTILQVLTSMTPSESGSVDVAAALAEAGARPLVAAPAGPLVSELQAKGGVWLDFPADARNPLAMALAVRRLRALLVAEQVDLVHVRARPPAWVAYAATRPSKIPLVTSLTQISPGRSIVRQRYDSVMAKGDVVMAGSRFTAATIASLYPAAAGKIEIVRPGLDLRPFAADGIGAARVQGLRRAWGILPDERIILLAARPSVWKGHKVLVEATRLLVERGSRDLKLVLLGAGKGGASREIDQAVKAAALEARVQKVEAASDMPAALLSAAVVVVPSIEAEAFGRVAIEAQAVGTPVVVSDLGALPEAVLAPPEVEASKRTGWRVPPSDPALLAEALAEALSLGASARDALALRARRQVEARYAIARLVSETLNVYTTAIERAASA